MPVYEQTVPATARACAGAGTPWVLDPVGVGIGSLRTRLIEAVRENPADHPARQRLGDHRRGRAVGASADDSADGASGDGPRGVDSTDSVDAAERAAVACARFTGGRGGRLRRYRPCHRRRRRWRGSPAARPS